MSKVRTPDPSGFTEFWAIWQPNSRATDGRGLARETFRKHILNGADPQDIIDGASWFIRNLKERDREFIPLSATWINREAYLDFCEKERAFQQHLASQAQNVIPIKTATPVLPANHFSRQWAKKKEASNG